MKTRRIPDIDLPLLATFVLALIILWGALSPPGGGSGGLPLTDKQMHVLAFAILISPLAFARFRRGLRAAPIVLAFGGLIEIVQPFVGRTAAWGDFMADGLGIGLGLALAWMFRRRAETRKS